MNDLIEQMHTANQQRRESERSEQRPDVRIAGWGWAAACCVLMVSAFLFLQERKEKSAPQLGQVPVRVAEMRPQVQRQERTEKTLARKSAESGASRLTAEGYAYTETDDGIRVYCENNCDGTEAVEQVEEMVKQSIVLI